MKLKEVCILYLEIFSTVDIPRGETHAATNVLQHPCICIFIRLCICELLYLYLDTLYNVDIPCCNSLTLGYLQCKPHNLSCDFDGLARLSGNTAYRSPYHPLAILSPPAF